MSSYLEFENERDDENDCSEDEQDRMHQKCTIKHEKTVELTGKQQRDATLSLFNL